MRASPFEFHVPRKLEEALDLLAQHGEEAKVLAGGMSLVPILTLGLARPSVLVSLNHMDGLDYVEDGGDSLRLGALVRHERVLTDAVVREHCPVLSAAAWHVGDVQIRHRGTVGGSLAHADPAADYLPVLYALDATVKIARAGGERDVKVRDFIPESLQTVLEPNEAVVEIQIPKVKRGTGWAYERLARVEGNFAIITAAALVNGDQAVAAVGAAKASPVIVTVPSGSQEEMATSMQGAAYEACAGAYSDLAAPAEYRRSMAGAYARRALEAALARRTT
jgi:aerobic carbon-monoxide dehydrogenase medium subunit